MQDLVSDTPTIDRILLVDDEPMVLNMLEESLRQPGHEIVAVADAESALDEAEKAPFDIVLTDLHLTGLNGVDLMVRLKAIHPGTPVIVVTGQPALDKAIDAMKKGAADFISKPFSVEQIRHVVSKNLKEHRLYAENQRLLAELNNKAVIETLNRQLHQKVDQLTKLYRISEAFHAYSDNQQLLQHVVDLAGELTEAERVSLLSVDREKGLLVIRASRGVSTEVQRKACIRIGEGVAGRVAQDFHPVRVTSKDPVSIESNGSRIYGSQSWLSVPLFIGGELFGVLNMTDKRDGSDFTQEDEYLALTLGEKAGIKVENNILYEGIYANLLDTLKALVSTIEVKDSYTRHHSHRVTETALTIARKIGCSEEECESIAFAGILHDIGKIGIRDNILLKTTRLTNDEYDVIKTHPALGESIVGPLQLIEAERNIIRHHHERYDGRGYPDKLEGDQIPLLARVVSVADAFDAMTSTRSYRRALPIEEVVSELRKNAGTQFDAEMVAALVVGLEEGTIVPYGDDSDEPGAEEHEGEVPGKLLANESEAAVS